MESTSLYQVKHFFIKFVFIVLLLTLFDQSVGLVLRTLYFRQKSGEESQLTYVIDNMVADILIFGSSRANHHYVPEIFEKRLNKICYNTGKDGSYFLYSWAIFKAIIKRYNPKLVIFDIRPYEFGNIPAEYERMSILLPYYKKYPEIRNVLNLRGPFEKLKNISAIYPYNSLIFQITRGSLNLRKSMDTDLKGYIPLFRIMNPGKIDTWNLSDIELDKNKLNALKDIISTCKEKKIKLVFVFSPMWKIVPKISCDEIITGICAEHGIDYINMSNDSLFLEHPEYFDDTSHLNNEGANVFSDLLIDRICHAN
jgi:hypothetical protein